MKGRFSLTALVVCGLATTTNAFAPLSTTAHSSSALHMGLFDGFKKAFANEAYGAPPDAVKAVARHILVPTVEEARAVKEKLATESFASLAQMYSTCPSGKSSGGSLGSFSPVPWCRRLMRPFSTPTRASDKWWGPLPRNLVIT